MQRFTLFAVATVAFLSFATPAFAQQAGINEFCLVGIPFLDLGALLSNLLALIFFFAALLAFVFILIGGIQWITAGGDKVAATSARDRITAAVVGLLIVVAAFAITIILNAVLGINLFGFQFPQSTMTAGAGGMPMSEGCGEPEADG